MYHGKEPEKKQKKRKRGKVAEFFMNAVAGRHLLMSWKKWVGWLVVATIISIIFIYNERVIDEKRERIRELEKVEGRKILQLKAMNDIVLGSESDEIDKAKEDGFVDVKEYDYYIIHKNQ